MKRIVLFLTVAVFFLAFHGTGQAQGIAPATNTALVNVQVSLKEAGSPTFFTAALEGSQEVPAVTTSASGTGTFVLDEKGIFYRITVHGLSGPMTGSHFHNAAAGVNGGVVRAIAFDGNTASGTWKVDDATQPLTQALLEELKAGRVYVNIHTAANPGGEIRGQVTAVSGTAFWTNLYWGQVFPGPASVTPPAGASAPKVDRVGFPEGYKDFKVFSMDRVDNRQLRNIYANEVAASTKPGEPYPYGSVLVLETFGTVHDPLGNVQRDANGRFIPSSAPPFVFVIRKEQGFGEDYKDIRNGEWEYAFYRADKTRVAPTATGTTTSCATCHLAAGTKKDFIFRGLSLQQRDAKGTAAFWMDGDNLRYRITVSGLSGPITGANFHNGANNANGPVTQPVTMEGNTTSGAWVLSSEMRTELTAGRIYVQIRTAANPDGEVRGQVVPVSVLGGLEVAFTRTISGRKWDFAWKGLTDEKGRVTVGITTKNGSPAGASGYYRVRMTNARTRTTVSDWASIPVRGGRMVDLLLNIGGPAAIVGPFFGTPIQSAGKPAAGPPSLTVLSGVELLAPSVSFGSAETREDGILDLPVQISDAKDLFGGDLTLTYDPALLSFRAGRVGETDLTVAQAEPGRVSLSFEGLTPTEQTGLMLSFGRRFGDALGNLRLMGLLYDQNLLPIAEVSAEARLNGEVPAHYALFQNHPNPFNPTTQIRYALPETGRVRLTVYNALGQVVTRLVDARQEAGTYTVTWDAREMASGIYYYRLESGAFKEVKRLVLLK